MSATTATATTTTGRTDADAATIAAFTSGALLLPAATVAAQADEDAVLDNWLASLEVSEFELILNRLADNQLGGRFLLEPTA